MKNLKWLAPLAFVSAFCGCSTAPNGAAPAGTSLPVYEVTKAGVTDSEAAALAGQLNIPAKGLLGKGGLVSFTDPVRYLAIPTAAVTDASLTDSLRYATENKDEKRPIDMRAIDTVALANLPVLEDRTALDTLARGLRAAGLHTPFGQPAAGHATLTLYSSEAGGKWSSTSQNLDTEVSYRFSEANGYPLVGPGAQVRAAFDGAGNVTRLHFSLRELKPGEPVQVISEREARDRIARLVPAGAEITTKLVYWCPPLSLGMARREEWNPAVIIPWYAYYSTTSFARPGSGGVSVMHSKVRLIPATDDARFVPAVQLTAKASGSEVSAHAAVTGGRPPYRYIWGGSNPEASRDRGDSTRYTAVVRVAESLASDPNFPLDRDEAVAVTVIDANGVEVRAGQTVPVHATPVHPREKKNKKHGSEPTYGIFSPGAPLAWMEDQVGWLQGMSTPLGGGGALNFCWMGANSWPGDFIEPNPAGTLVATPWVNGDADYANWGVNTADLVLDNADGSADGKTVMQPGAPIAKYATASLFAEPNIPDTVAINGNGFGTPKSYFVNYVNSWGPVGPNDTLYWLLLDDCNMLDATDGTNGTGPGVNVADRWGLAFNGLHILTGFASLDQPDGYGDFERDFATDMLGMTTIIGIPFPTTPMTIVQSWFASAEDNGIGTPAAMGPALPTDGGKKFTMEDLNDYYWGKGSVGPTIVPSHYEAGKIGFWYLTSTTPINVVFP